jgi:hypothetical protein
VLGQELGVLALECPDSALAVGQHVDLTGGWVNLAFLEGFEQQLAAHKDGAQL